MAKNANHKGIWPLISEDKYNHNPLPCKLCMAAIWNDDHIANI